MRLLQSRRLQAITEELQLLFKEEVESLPRMSSACTLLFLSQRRVVQTNVRVDLLPPVFCISAKEHMEGTPPTTTPGDASPTYADHVVVHPKNGIPRIHSTPIVLSRHRGMLVYLLLVITVLRSLKSDMHVPYLFLFINYDRRPIFCC